AVADGPRPRLRRLLLGGRFLGVILDGRDLGRLDRGILGVVDLHRILGRRGCIVRRRGCVVRRRGCVVRRRGLLIRGLLLALDAAGPVIPGGIGQGGESGGGERDGKGGRAGAEARTQSHRLGTPSPWCARQAALGDICGGSGRTPYPTGPLLSGPWCRRAGGARKGLCMGTRLGDLRDTWCPLGELMTFLVGPGEPDQPPRAPSTSDFAAS